MNIKDYRVNQCLIKHSIRFIFMVWFLMKMNKINIETIMKITNAILYKKTIQKMVQGKDNISKKLNIETNNYICITIHTVVFHVIKFVSKVCHP